MFPENEKRNTVNRNVGALKKERKAGDCSYGIVAMGSEERFLGFNYSCDQQNNGQEMSTIATDTSDRKVTAETK